MFERNVNTIGGLQVRKVLIVALMVCLATLIFASAAYAGKPAPAPTVSITSPASGATVSGTSVSISADCTGGGSGYTVTGVTYRVDSGSEVAMSGPDGSESGTWSANWDSTQVSDGSHTIYVTATNSAGKTTTSSVDVTVSNGGGGGTGPHDNLLWSEYPGNCLSCHDKQFKDMYQSVMYQWVGNAPDNVNQPSVKQGKISNAVNSYCVNILGNWNLCGRCHAGRGAKPEATGNPTSTQLKNIDCLVCHNEAYALARVRLSDGTMGPPSGTDEATLNSYVRNIHKPTRTNCLKCHAYAGGGDAVKRGTLAAAHMNTTDSNYDVHMATGRGNLPCYSCHSFRDIDGMVIHKVTGKGSDLRQTDYAAEVKCVNCHVGKDTATGHATADVNKHVARVACQTCHIPVYGKDAADTTATEATEMHRSWLDTSHHGSNPPFHPGSVKANNVKPKYKFWNRLSDSILLFDMSVVDVATGAYPTSRPIGYIDGPLGNKLYPFKYKTAEQPIRDANKVLIAIDTYEYILVSGDPILATQKGLANMGYNSNDSFSWVITDTYQLLNHQIPPKASALACSTCHENTSQMNLPGELGYNLKAAKSVICSQCHKEKNWKGYVSGHSRHVDTKNYDCSWCHTFSRPEKGGTMP